jgi:hypothetical protein
VLRDFLMNISSGFDSGELKLGENSDRTVKILDIPPLYTRLSAASTRRMGSLEQVDDILSSSDIIASMFSYSI